MKVITIVQPWATLIAIGEKKFETRSWRTKYRGELAIHAGKKIDKTACSMEPFRSVLAKHEYSGATLPTGVILATCRLADCLEVIQNRHASAILSSGDIVSGSEYKFGNFQTGRFAWEVQDVTCLREYIPAKGQLGLWEYPLTFSPL